MQVKNWLNRLFGSAPEPVPNPSPQSTQPVAPPVAAPPQTVQPAELSAAGRPPHTVQDTLKLPIAKPATAATSLCHSAFCVGRATDVGRVRNHNEDAMYIFVGEQEGSNAVPPFGLFVLADGMGGHQSGEFASALACRVVAEQLLGKVYLPMLGGMERDANQPPLRDILVDAISAANQAVAQSLPNSGTTLTCGMIMGGRLLIGHVGDSRAYLLREGAEPQLLTNDHSLVHRLMEMGQLTAEEAAVHPQRNVLYRAVGQGTPLDVDIILQTLQRGDRLLFCSDGLWNLVPDPQLWEILAAAATPQAACNQMVEAANAAGGNDNITVILVEVWRDPA